MSYGAEFNPNRLGLARRRRGLTKRKLAELIGADVRAVTAYESGEYKPERERLLALADQLHFPVQFFVGSDVEEVTPDVVSFRSMSKMTAGQRDAALGAGAVALMLNEWIEERFELPAAQLPDLSHESSPAVAAAALRRIWGLGELPIKNMVHLLEARGVRVFSLSLDTAHVDAYSMWHASTPFVFLNTMKSCERSRFDAAHELGHLILHRHAGPKVKDAERQANEFASAFLMPEGSVLANAPVMATVDQLIAHKVFWTVSVAALAYRLKDLKLVNEWHYRSLCIEIAQRGYQKSEPNSAPRETSQVFQKVFAALRADGMTRANIADQLAVHVNELDELVFGLALTALVGDAEVLSRPRRPVLQVIEGGRD